MSADIFQRRDGVMMREVSHPGWPRTAYATGAIAAIFLAVGLRSNEIAWLVIAAALACSTWSMLQRSRQTIAFDAAERELRIMDARWLRGTSEPAPKRRRVVGFETIRDIGVDVCEDGYVLTVELISGETIPIFSAEESSSALQTSVRALRAFIGPNGAAIGNRGTAT
jgi:hypothetical protein